jgi:hypothetical protein
MRPLGWPNIAATSFCLTFLVVGALYFSTYMPKPFSETEQTSSRTRSLANCGAGMFDVVPHAPQCPAFEAIALESTPCGPDCEAYTLTLQADGKAVLEVDAPASERGRFVASVGSAQYRELANVLALLELDRRGELVEPAPGAPGFVLRAGCGGQWPVEANHGSVPGEAEAIQRCLVDVKNRADWSLKPAKADEPVATGVID